MILYKLSMFIVLFMLSGVEVVASDLSKWRQIDKTIGEAQKKKNLFYRNKEQLLFNKVVNNLETKKEKSLRKKKFKIYKYIDDKGRVKFEDRKKHSGFKALSLHKYRARKRPHRVAKSSRLGYEKGRRVYGPIINNISKQFGVPSNFVHAVISAESAYDSQAVSTAGAVGLMQLMPATANRYGVSNRRDPIQNIKGGTKYLRDLLKLFNGNLRLTAAAYNAGENAVLKYNRNVPPYKETQNYVVKVLKFYDEIESK